MRVPRAFVDAELASGQRVDLADETAHYCRRVLRLRDGAALRLFNGAPGDWQATLRLAGKQAAAAEVGEFEPRATEPALPITLVQGISRGQRMDYTLEKSVEPSIFYLGFNMTDAEVGAPAGERGRWMTARLAMASASKGCESLCIIYPFGLVSGAAAAQGGAAGIRISSRSSCPAAKSMASAQRS